MSSGCSPAVILKSSASQWAETIRIAFGRLGRVAATPLRKSAMPFQVPGGFHSMKKQGPAPWGMKRTGWAVDARTSCMILLQGLRPVSGSENHYSFTPLIGEPATISRSEEHTSELQSRPHLVCRLL